MHVELRILKSKTSLYPSSVVLAHCDDWMCPVHWLSTYLGRLPASSEALFTQIKSGKLTSMRISKNVVATQLRRWLELSGVNAAEISGHSLRRGGATAAVLAGVPEVLIKQHGRWKSDAVHAYIAPTLEKRLEITSAL